MTAKRVVPREQAHRDVERTIDHYAREAGADIAFGFVDALEAGYRTIEEHPGVGSPRYAHELDLPGLRHRRLARFPHLIFYVERDDHIDVWRVLDARSDIPAWLGDPEDSQDDPRRGGPGDVSRGRKAAGHDAIRTRIFGGFRRNPMVVFGKDAFDLSVLVEQELRPRLSCRPHRPGSR